MTTPAMDFALEQPFVPDFAAVEVRLPFYTLRLLAGGSQVTFMVPDLLTDIPAPQTFFGEDEVYGTLGSLEATSEGLGTVSPKMRLAINPPTHAAAAQLNLPTNQMAQTRLWYGVLNPETGEVIGTELQFWGFLNQPRFIGGQQNRAVEYDVSSVLDFLFANDEGQRLNHQTLTKAFPGARGLEYVSDIERTLPWGSDAARSPLISAANGNYAASPAPGPTAEGSAQAYLRGGLLGLMAYRAQF